MIYIENKKKYIKTLRKYYPNAEIIDLTSKGEEPYVKLSPFYPHDNIPIPFSPNNFSSSVEGIWQGLKVFEKEDIDISKFKIRDMKGLKRTIRKFGKPLGHRLGINGQLIDYLTARKKIYLPTYAWILQNKATLLIETIKNIAYSNDIVFLDYETNEDIENTSKPLSHAALVKKYIEKKYPELSSIQFTKKDIIKSDTGKKDKKKRKQKENNKLSKEQFQLDFE